MSVSATPKCVKRRCREYQGFSTRALPPPRRVGSAAACTVPTGRKAKPVAAPISGVEVKVCPWSETSSFASCVFRNAGSAEVWAVLRWEALGGGYCLREGHAEVEVVDHCLQHSRDDGGASGRTEGEYRVSVAGDDGGAYAAPRALAARGGVGQSRCRLEVGQLVVEEEAVSRNRDRAPSRLLYGEGVGNYVAPLVGDGEVRGGWSFRGRGRLRADAPRGASSNFEGRSLTTPKPRTRNRISRRRRRVFRERQGLLAQLAGGYVLRPPPRRSAPFLKGRR